MAGWMRCGWAVLVLPVVVGCGSSAGPAVDTGADGASPSTFTGNVSLFTAKWQCEVTPDPGSNTNRQEPFITDATGSTLSVFSTTTDSTALAAWFCGYNYLINGLTASLVGMPMCTSIAYTVTLTSAMFTVTADGNELSLQETGRVSDPAVPEPAMVTATCARQP